MSVMVMAPIDDETHAEDCYLSQWLGRPMPKNAVLMITDPKLHVHPSECTCESMSETY